MTAEYNVKKKLENALTEHAEGQKPLIFLHPGDKRDYSDEEVDALNSRDFETRLFIGSINIEGLTVFLRTHFTDNAEYSSKLNYIRDYFKATHAMTNSFGAKATLAEILKMWFNLEPSHYYSFATTLASALSENAKNTSFEIAESMVATKEDVKVSREKFCLLMDILFSKMSTKKFLIDDGGSNTFRLAHCSTKCGKGKKPLFFAVFSFLLQCCLTAYVINENITEFREGKGIEIKMLPLAVITFVYSAMVSYPGVAEAKDAFDVYGKIGPLQMIDFIVNQILPFVLMFSGFYLIGTQENFIDAVLNTAALLFIPEIDDQLPELLGFPEEQIIQNYIIYEAMVEYDEVSKMCNEDVSKTITMRAFTNERNSIPLNANVGVQFSDIYITNLIEEGSDPNDGLSYTPYQIRVGNHKGYKTQQIDPSNFVTENCLLRKITWSYTSYNPKNTKPRVGYLRLEKLDGSFIEIPRSDNLVLQKERTKLNILEKKHTLNGIYVITTFQMSSFVIKLRVCGSRDAESFVKAFEYYSLWDISSSAMNALTSEIKRNPPHGNQNMVPYTTETFDDHAY